MKILINISFFILFAATVFAQSPNTPPILFSSRFQITNAVNGTGDTIVISGYTDDCTTRFSNNDIAIGDSLYVLEGTDLLIFGVVTTRTISLGIATFKVRDFNGAGLLPSNGQAAIFRPTTDYDFPGYVCGLNDGLQQYISDRFRQNLDAALSNIVGVDSVTYSNDSAYIHAGDSTWFSGIIVGGTVDSTIYATVYSRDTAAVAIRGEIAALAQPPFDSTDIATGGIGNTDLGAAIVSWSKLAQPVKDSINAGGSSTIVSITDTITQASHSITLTSGFKPIYYTGSAYAVASTTSAATLPQIYVVGAPDANTLIVQQSGKLAATAHGLTVGEDYYLLDNGSYSTTPDGDGDSIDYNVLLVHVVDANTLFLQEQRHAGNIILAVDDGTNTSNLKVGVVDLTGTGVKWDVSGSNTIDASLDITGLPTLTSIADDDSIAVWDNSANALKSVSKVNFIGSSGSIFSTSGTASGSQTWDLGTTNQLWNYNSGVTTPLFYLGGSTGRIGIGKSNPSYQLDLTGAIAIPNTTTSLIGVIYMGSDWMHTYGADNLFWGSGAGNLTTTGTRNHGFGKDALKSLTNGGWNYIEGYEAGDAITSANGNVGIGYQVLGSVATGSNNVGIGFQALSGATAAVGGNVGIGTSVLQNITTSNSTAIGASALTGAITATNTVGVGREAGRQYYNGITTATLTYVTNSVVLGAESKANQDTVDNMIVIGYQAVGKGSNTIALGNTSVTDLYCRNYRLDVDQTMGASQDGFILTHNNSTGIQSFTTPRNQIQAWQTINTTGAPTVNTASVQVPIKASSASGAVDVQIAPATTGVVYRIVATDVTNTLRIAPTSGTINGSATFTFTSQYQAVDVMSDGTNLFIF